MFNNFNETAKTIGASDWNVLFDRRDFTYETECNANLKNYNQLSAMNEQQQQAETLSFLQGYPFSYSNDNNSVKPTYNNFYNFYSAQKEIDSPSSCSSSSLTASPSSDNWKVEDVSGSSSPANNSYLCTAPTLEEMDYNAAVVFLSQLAEQVQMHHQHHGHFNTVVEAAPIKEAAVHTLPRTMHTVPRVSEENYDAQLTELMQAISPSKVLYDPKNEQVDPCVPPPRRRSSAAQAAAAAINPPRPPNAFILYRRHQQAHLRLIRPGVHLRVASKLIAIWWKNETEAVKIHYRKVAQEEKSEHMKKYPEYRYKPRLDGRKRKEAPAIMGLVSRKTRSPVESPEASPSVESYETPAYMRMDMFDSFLRMPDEE